MFGQKNIYLIVVKAHALEIFGHGEEIETINIPVNVVNNFEVIDRDALYSLIANWTKSIPYQASEIIWLLTDDLVFEQRFLEKDREKWDTMAVQFLDTVPFEEVLSHVYSPVEGRTIIATNQDLLNALMHGFSVQGYITLAVIPAKLTSITMPLNKENAKKILSSQNQILRDNMVTPEIQKDSKTIDPKEPSDSGAIPKPKPKSQLPLLITVFVILVAILLIVLYLNQ